MLSINKYTDLLSIYYPGRNEEEDFQIVEKRFSLIFDSTQLNNSGSNETDRFTDKGPFFFGRTINYGITPKLINTSITITFLVILKLTNI